MEIFETTIPGVLRLRPKVFADERGRFLEAFNSRAFVELTGIATPFVQDNESCSKVGVLRGLHLQVAPYAQAKLVRVVQGAALDVCVDLRKGSTTFGKYFSLRLDDVVHELLYIPEGFAHGFLALEEGTIFQYKCSSYYAPVAERTLRWDDPDLNIDWGIKDPIVSEKDRAGSFFADRPWET